MGLIINQKIPYGGGGGKGLEHWTETEDSIYNKSEGETIDSDWMIEEITKGYSSFNTYASSYVYIEPDKFQCRNEAKIDALSYCYPTTNENTKSQPDDFSFYSLANHTYFNSVYTNHQDLNNLKLRSYLSEYTQYISNPLMFFDYQHYASWFTPQLTKTNGFNKTQIPFYPLTDGQEYARFQTHSYADHPQLPYTYAGLVNLNIYNNKAYGDIGGLRGYNKDYYKRCLPNLDLCFYGIENIILVAGWSDYYNGHWTTYGDEEWALTLIAIYVKNSHHSTVVEGEIVEVYTDPAIMYGILHPYLEWIDNVSSTYLVEIKGVVDAYQGYDPATFTTTLETILGYEHCGYRLTNDEHAYFVGQAGTDKNAAVTRTITTFTSYTPSILDNPYIDDINEFAEDNGNFLYLISYCYNKIHDAGKIVPKSYLTRESFYINTRLYYQEKADTTYSLERDNDSDYLSFSRTMPFIYNICCLGRIYERGNYQEYNRETGEFQTIGEWEDPENVRQLTDYVSTAPLHPNESVLGGYDVTLPIYDQDVIDDTIVTEEFTYKDRSMSQGGIFTDERGIAWYVFLTPAKRLFYWLDGISDADEPYSTVNGEPLPPEDHPADSEVIYNNRDPFLNSYKKEEIHSGSSIMTSTVKFSMIFSRYESIYIELTEGYPSSITYSATWSLDDISDDYFNQTQLSPNTTMYHDENNLYITPLSDEITVNLIEISANIPNPLTRTYSFLQMDSVPNHWSYYNGADPVDTVKTYTRTHTNGYTYTYNITSLSDASETKYNNNFIKLAKQILKATGLTAIKPFFGEGNTTQIKTSINVETDDYKAFSTGINYSDDSFDEKFSVNGKTGDTYIGGNLSSDGDASVKGDIKSTNLTVKDSIKTHKIYLDNVNINQIYQPMLIAGENITIEDNVISATGGGGGGSSDYSVTPHIVCKWCGGQNVYEVTFYRTATSTSTYFQANFSVVGGTQAQLSNTELQVLSIEGSMNVNENRTPSGSSSSVYCKSSYPLNYYESTTKWIRTSAMIYRSRDTTWRLRVEWAISNGFNFDYTDVLPSVTVRFALPTAIDPSA